MTQDHPPAAQASIDDALEFHRRGQLEQAEQLCRAILAADARDFDATHLLGLILLQRGQFPLAERQFALAVEIDPSVATAHSNRAFALRCLKRSAEALPCYDSAIALAPDDADAFINRGATLYELGRVAEAAASYDRAIALQPDHAPAFNYRGIALKQLSRLDDALASFDQAIAVKPDYAEAFNSRAIVLNDLGRFDEALASLDRAVALNPNYAEALRNRGLSKLQLGLMAEGWRDYEQRWNLSEFQSRRPPLTAPIWAGENLQGRSILVYGEQGLGDMIQFCRYLPLLAAQGAEVTFLGPPNLLRLFAGLSTPIRFTSSLIPGQHFDAQCALMGLPLRFGTTLTNIPPAPYLRADPQRTAEWSRRLGAEGFKIGICWQGKPNSRADLGRSFPLRELQPLAQIPNVRLISLQKVHGLEQLVALPADMKVETPGEFDVGHDAFVDSAAIMQNLDLVITTDTATAHLAGALGWPAWVALRKVPDWRWMLERGDSPWYPSMRLFRQPVREDWVSVFHAMADELRRLVSVRRNA